MTLTRKTPDNISISRLCNALSFAPFLASTHAREWGHLYAAWNEKAALADFQLETGNSAIPTTWVIHDQSKALMGSVSLVMDDLPGHSDLNPWLASLYVFPEFRGRGLGKLLVRQAVDFLRQQKYPHAYLFTEDQVPFFSKFGFFVHSPTKANGHPVTIMKSLPRQELVDGRSEMGYRDPTTPHLPPRSGPIPPRKRNTNPSRSGIREFAPLAFS